MALRNARPRRVARLAPATASAPRTTLPSRDDAHAEADPQGLEREPGGERPGCTGPIITLVSTQHELMLPAGASKSLANPVI